MREGSPWQRDARALGSSRCALGFGAANRSDAAFTARDALRRFMQIADRAFAADRSVIAVLRLNTKAGGQQLFRIAIAPAQEVDDIEGVDFVEEPRAAVGFRALERFDQ